MVHPQFRQKFLLFGQGRKQAETARIILQDSTRMRPEGEHHALIPPGRSRLDKLPDHLTVSQMDPVEKAGGDYSHFTSGKS